jgi:hypothetical protein
LQKPDQPVDAVRIGQGHGAHAARQRRVHKSLDLACPAAKRVIRVNMQVYEHLLFWDRVIGSSGDRVIYN